VFGLAVLEISPTCLNFGSGFKDGGLDGFLEAGEGSLPDLGDFLTKFNDVALAASGTFIAGLEESSVLCLHLGKGCLVDHILVVSDEGAGGVGIPGLNVSLDTVKVDVSVGNISFGLTHVGGRLGLGTLDLEGSRLFDSVGSGQGSSNYGSELHLSLV